MLVEEWRKLRSAILYRDGHVCQRCTKHSASGKTLTVHHIIPREEGGSDDPENLITLCNECHDFVEINDLRILADIIGSIDLGIREADPLPDLNKQESFDRPDWHAWVYGGGKNPQV